MAVIDSRAAVTYQMDFTIRVQPSVTMGQIARAVVDRSAAIHGPIENLILTAHGSPGSFQLGAGLDINTMAPFHLLQGNVRKIWFRGCLVGRIIESRTAGDGDWAALKTLGLTAGNGHAFLEAFARLTHCMVIAPTEMQASHRTEYPPGQMDSYEGLVVIYNEEGRLVSRTRNPSLFAYARDGRSAVIPNRE